MVPHWCARVRKLIGSASEDAGLADDGEHMADTSRGNPKARASEHVFVLSQDVRGDDHEDSLVRPGLGAVQMLGGSDALREVARGAGRFNFRVARQPLEMFKAVPHAFLYTEQGPVRWVR